MAWFTTDDGRRVNTEWFDKEDQQKYEQIAKNQEEADKRNGKVAEKIDRYEKVPGLIFGTAHITNTYIDIDGYSNKSTEKGMLGDLAKAVERYDKGEADSIRMSIRYNEIEQLHPRKDEPAAQYICEWEQVPSASRHIDEDGKASILSGKDGKDIEHKEAKYYVHIRFTKD